MAAEPLIVLFDGTCGFCTRCARFAVEHAPAGRVSAMASQAPGVLERYGLSPADAEASVWTIEPDGTRLRGARAVARLARAMGGRWALLGRVWLLPGAELAYRSVAARRQLLSRLWGDLPPYG